MKKSLARRLLTFRILGFPVYGIIAGIFMFALQRWLYVAANAVSVSFGIPWHTSKIAWIDDRIGLVPSFITIYILSYLFWILGPIVVSRNSPAYFFDFLAGMLLAYLIGAVIFVIYPTRMDRVAENLLNDNPGFFNYWLQMIFRLDGDRYGTNLMPSYHCLISTCCCIGVGRRSNTPAWYRIFSYIFTILIFASTVLCKQHYVIDIPTGILIAVAGHMIMNRIHPGQRIARVLKMDGQA